jgi:tetratricopeptide (TPR) repeat protein
MHYILLVSLVVCNLFATQVSSSTATAQTLVQAYKLERLTLDNSIVITQNNSSLAERYNNSGNQKMDVKNYQGALADYNEAIELNPKYATAYSNRGGLKAATNDIKGGLADLNRAIDLDPNLALAYANRGGVKMVSLKDYKGALIDLNRAIKLDPKSKLAYTNRALTRYYLHDKADGISDIQKLIPLLEREGIDTKSVLGTMRKWQLEIKKAGAVKL